SGCTRLLPIECISVQLLCDDGVALRIVVRAILPYPDSTLPFVAFVRCPVVSICTCPGPTVRLFDRRQLSVGSVAELTLLSIGGFRADDASFRVHRDFAAVFVSHDKALGGTALVVFISCLGAVSVVTAGYASLLVERHIASVGKGDVTSSCLCVA